MIVAIERTKFTYLYKYNQIRVDINQLIDKSTDVLKGMLTNDLNRLIQLFNVAIPLFEQDHEIILLEIDKSKMNLQNGISISFDSISCIYPLSKTGQQLLEGKINEDFIVESPLFEKVVEALKLERSLDFRRKASRRLVDFFELERELDDEIISLIESSVKKNLLNKTEHQELNSYLDHLISYNKTPSYIPDGNIEHICKIGVIAVKSMGRAEEVFTNGPFYKLSVKYKHKINSPSYLTSYSGFYSIIDLEFKSSIENLVDIISKDFSGFNIFKVSYFFLAFKSFLNKHDNNIVLLKNDINSLIFDDRTSAAMVLVLIGYSFSFENLYNGIHVLANAPLLKNSSSTNHPLYIENKLNEKKRDGKRLQKNKEITRNEEKERLDHQKKEVLDDKANLNTKDELNSINSEGIKKDDISESILLHEKSDSTQNELKTDYSQFETIDNNEVKINNDNVNLKEKNEQEIIDQMQSGFANNEMNTDLSVDFEAKNEKEIHNEISEVNNYKNIEDSSTTSALHLNESIKETNEASDSKDALLDNSIDLGSSNQSKKTSKETKAKTEKPTRKTVDKLNDQAESSDSPDIVTDQMGKPEEQSTEVNDIQNSSKGNRVITVQVFEELFLTEFLNSKYENKEKIELWLGLMRNFFPEKNEIISYKKLNSQFQIDKYSIDKMFDSESEIKKLKEFFKNYNQ